MVEIINLRRVKKALAARAAAGAAAVNRAKHGRTPAERDADATAARQRDRQLDGARLDDARLDDTRLEADDGATPPRTS